MTGMQEKNLRLEFTEEPLFFRKHLHTYVGLSDFLKIKRKCLINESIDV